MWLPAVRVSAAGRMRLLLPALLALTSALAGQAAPPSAGLPPSALAAVPCKTAADCQHNGVCTARTGMGTGTSCRCSPGWSGDACGTLAVAPAAPANGLQQTYPNGSWTSTWGGSIQRVGGAHYLLAAEITNGCPVKQYTTNASDSHLDLILAPYVS